MANIDFGSRMTDHLSLGMIDRYIFVDLLTYRHRTLLYSVCTQ